MRRLVAAAAAGIGVFLLSAPAWAHVSVSAPGATRGGSNQVITFRVPVEKDVPTVGLTVALPTSTPIAPVHLLPLPGWTHAEKTIQLARDGGLARVVSQITWTAHNGGLRPGEFGEFTIIAGQLPDVARLRFPALQTYADGSVVRWNEHAAPGTPEPANPAPVLELPAGDAGAQRDAVPTPASAKDADTTAPTVLAIIAIVVAAAALGVAVVGNARRKSKS